MSLDVYLSRKGVQNLASGPAIFICENGQTKQIDRDEWNRRFPDREPVTVELPSDDEAVFVRNITHNLGAMAQEAAIYSQLWRPDENGITKAHQLIQPLREGLALLKAEPKRFKALNPKNGWGDYEGLVVFVTNYLDACEKNPDADVSVSR